MNRKKSAHGRKAEKKDKFFSRMSFRTIGLSLVALIQIILLITGTTFSWVETISSLMINGSGRIDVPVKTVANIGSGSDYSHNIDLDEYFKKAGNVHLSTCSSANGTDFFFPIVGDGNRYRKATMNDNNVNYISYSFKVVNKDSNKKDFKFGNVPSIKIGNVAVTDNKVRIAITAGDITTIFSNKAVTERVVGDTTGATAATDVKAFSAYTNSTGTVTSPVFSLDANAQTDVRISIWLQDNGDNNGTVNIDNFTLVSGDSKKSVEVKYGVGSDSSMGDISVGTEGKKVYYGDKGDSVQLNQNAKTGYKFMGWYTDYNCTVKASLTDNNFTIGDETDYVFYALFKKTYTLMAISVTDNVQGGTGGTVKINDGTASDSATKNDATVGEIVTITATPKEGYNFVGWYDNLEGGTQFAGEQETTIVMDNNDRTVYARFEIKIYKVTATAVSEEGSNGGTVQYGDENKALIQVSVKHGNSVTFTAKEIDGSGYVFDGWYSDSACTSANKLSDNKEYTLSSVTADTNVYAKFKLIEYTIDVYALSYNDLATTPTEQSNYGNVMCDSSTVTHFTRVVKYGKSISFTAVANDYCDFEGWYNKTDDSELQNSTNMIYAIESFNGNTPTSIYAKFKIKTKTINVHTVKGDSSDTSTAFINHTETTATVNYGDTVTLSANGSANAVFMGWYKDEECTQTIGEDYLDINLSKTVDNSTITDYYAKFEKKTTMTIYFKNKSTYNWSKVCAYMWKDDKSNIWPGKEMTKVDGTSYYQIEVDLTENYANIIFNNGSNVNQTGTLTLPSVTDENNCYNYETGKWEEYAPSTDKYTIYLTNNLSWSTPHCYAWNESGENAKWPGVAMTDTGKENDHKQKIYKIEFDASYTGIIFNDGSNNQTTDITGFANGTAYFLTDKNGSGKYNVSTWDYNP